jgi:TrmH family RNA methyltransferase
VNCNGKREAAGDAGSRGTIERCMERISSRQNPLVKRFRQMRDEPGEQWMLLDGEHLVREALASGLHIDVAAVAEGLAATPGGLASELERNGVAVVAVTSQVLEAVSPVRQPSGVVAVAQRPSSAVDVFQAQPALVLILSGVQDPGNVGAIVRAAEACGATGLIVTTGTASPFGWKALRGAMGSTFRLPIATNATTESAVSRARASGLRVLATTAREGVPLPACDLRAGCVILLGAEGPGLPVAVLETADERITIPMRPPVESLNVAISAALVLYEAARQRTAAPVLQARTNVAF